MKKNYDFCLSALLVLMTFLLIMNGIRRNDEALAERIAPNILRFHVLANSNSPQDQTLKLEVKDFLLKEIEYGLFESKNHLGNDKMIPGRIESITETNDTLSREIICQYITDNCQELEQAAQTYMISRGFSYPAKIQLETCEFPERIYGDMTFPAGMYDAVRVVIGDGNGENFWCVLYPSLCYMDSTHAVMPDSSKELLQTLIPEDDFQALLTARRQFSKTKTEQESLLPRIHIRLKLFDLLREHP